MGKFLESNKGLIFKKYTKEELIDDINRFVNGKGKLYKILNHFFEELIFESCGKGTSISPMDVLKDDEKIEDIFKYIKTKPNFYKGDDIANLKSWFRNAVSWVRKVANFDPTQARQIYFRYHDIDGKKLNVLDTSSGFGSRMSAVLLSGHNYYSFDPNQKLNTKLNEYLTFLKQNDILKSDCVLYCQGSEVCVDELENTIDVSFTSPPYFNLETYSKDDNCASTINYDNYQNWINLFAEPTIKNTYKYLKVGGYAMINIKNINKKAPIYDDFFKIFSSIDGFEYVETFDMKIASKKNYGMAEGRGDIPASEPVMVFKKIK